PLPAARIRAALELQPRSTSSRPKGGLLPPEVAHQAQDLCASCVKRTSGRGGLQPRPAAEADRRAAAITADPRARPAAFWPVSSASPAPKSASLSPMLCPWGDDSPPKG